MPKSVCKISSIRNIIDFITHQQYPHHKAPYTEVEITKKNIARHNLIRALYRQPYFDALFVASGLQKVTLVFRDEASLKVFIDLANSHNFSRVTCKIEIVFPKGYIYKQTDLILNAVNIIKTPIHIHIPCHTESINTAENDRLLHLFSIVHSTQHASLSFNTYEILSKSRCKAFINALQHEDFLERIRIDKFILQLHPTMLDLLIGELAKCSMQSYNLSISAFRIAKINLFIKYFSTNLNSANPSFENTSSSSGSEIKTNSETVEISRECQSKKKLHFELMHALDNQDLQSLFALACRNLKFEEISFNLNSHVNSNQARCFAIGLPANLVTTPIDISQICENDSLN